MQVTLDYGIKKIPVDIPDVNLAGLITPRQEQADITQNASILSEILKNESGRFQEQIANHRLTVLLADATRDLPTDVCLGAIVSLLSKCSTVQFILCTGTHTAQTKENLALCKAIQKIWDQNHSSPVEVLIHDCQNARFLDAGVTSRGTSMHYNAAIKDTDVFLVLSDVKPHYFAGYSNPVKNFVPGICDYETTRGNHSLTLDAASTFCVHPWHKNPAQQNQPLAADQVEAMEAIVKGRPIYALTTISSHQAIQWAAFGPIRQVCQKAFAQADLWNLHTVNPVLRLIVSPGGYPNDMDLYIAQRALELTEQAVLDGGEILFVSACQDGIGPQTSMEHFWDILIRPLDEIDRTIEGNYKLFSHKPYRFARLIQRLRKLYVFSEMPDDHIIAAHMTPVDNPQDIIDGWLKEDHQTKILVVNGANKLALRTQ
jgi:nickel-dependent lactate racemase